jgi:hypothetical protein
MRRDGGARAACSRSSSAISQRSTATAARPFDRLGKDRLCNRAERLGASTIRLEKASRSARKSGDRTASTGTTDLKRQTSGVVTVTGGVQRGREVEPCFMRRQPHLATGRLLA